MWDILASRRGVILDDQDEAAASALALNSSATVGPQRAYGGDSAPPARGPSWDVAPRRPDLPPEFAQSPPDASRKGGRSIAAPPSTSTIGSGSALMEEERPVLPVTDAAIVGAFAALSADVSTQSSEMIETLARQMLRPMLRIWLDDNFPDLVERLLRDEVQRIARGGRRTGG